ncbi:MAG TPA: hypothetical protein VFO38_03925 [Candidatus Saccharimonadales bacterium]|nr:hypothetical protein [Candidatus Saccharimonadales bacterium]
MLKVEIDVRKLTTSPLIALNDALTTMSCIKDVDITQVSFAETKSVVDAASLALSLLMRQGLGHDREKTWELSYVLWLRLLTVHQVRSWCRQCRHPVGGDDGLRHKGHAGELVVDRSALVGLGDPALLRFGDDCPPHHRTRLVVFLREVHAGKG